MIVKMLPRTLLVGCCSALFGLVVPALVSAAPVTQSAVATTDAPRVLIGELDDALLATMKQAKALGYAGRYRKLAPTVGRAYDFSAVAELVLGPHWSRFSPAQKQEFIAALTDYTVATYAARFDGYAGERFSIKSVQSLRPDRAVVYTLLTESDGTTHRLDYLMQSTDGQWRIVNVVADGVSDLALKHAEFTHLLDARGFPGLIAGLKHYTARLAREAH